MKNHNPHVDEFLRFYSQSDTSTGGTRGYDPRTYVETTLDEKLTPAIFNPNTKLVILSGNAGDGKTAYIQRVEAQAKTDGGEVSYLRKDGKQYWVVARRNIAADLRCRNLYRCCSVLLGAPQCFPDRDC